MALLLNPYMGESFQDYSWIQDFEADFQQKVSLKILNYGDNNTFSHLFSVCLKAIEHLTWNCEYLVGIYVLQVLKLEFQKFRILKILTFHQCPYDAGYFHEPHLILIFNQLTCRILAVSM